MSAVAWAPDHIQLVGLDGALSVPDTADRESHGSLFEFRCNFGRIRKYKVALLSRRPLARRG